MRTPASLSITRVIRLSILIALLPSVAYAADACIARHPNFDSSSCPSGYNHILGAILCQFMSTIDLVKDSLLTAFYCKMGPIAQILGSIYIMFYGIELMIGSTKFNTKHALGRLAKVMIVVSLMTQGSTINMNVVYNFFISLALEVPAYFIGSVPGSGNLSISGSGTQILTTLFGSIDGVIGSAISSTEQKMFGIGIEKFLGFAAAMLLVSTQVSQIGTFIWQLVSEVFMLIVQTMVNILLGLTVIGFLVALGPLFVGFYLFEQTKHLCESWIRHLTSYSLQIVFVLAAFTLWAGVIQQYKDFFGQLDKAIAPWTGQISKDPNLTVDESTWAACKGEMTKGGNGALPTFGCSQANQQMIPANAISQDNTDFMGFALYYLTSLLCITYGFGALVKQARGIAQQIAGGGVGGGALDGFGLGNTGKFGAKGDASQVRGAQRLRATAESDGAKKPDGEGGGIANDIRNTITKNIVNRPKDASAPKK
ncbi:MAG: hypothetical protein EBR02_07770 [Alphaproteobacteria bacterium]|nr:hypothetical protein [Alphaproteobacteria bacterium]